MKRILFLALFLAGLTFFAGCQSDSVTPQSLDETQPLDITPPTATLIPLEEEQTSLQFLVAYEAEDDQSGVAGVEILVQTPDQVWTSLGIFTESPVTFIADGMGPHAFKCSAIDSAGNQQEFPDLAQAETLVPEPIILVDNRGEAFDITNAVLRYHLTAEAWEHGIGRYTIVPVIDPVWVVRGDFAYPDDNNLADVIAITDLVEFHAYRVGDINNREVINDYMGGAHVAVTY